MFVQRPRECASGFFVLWIAKMKISTLKKPK